MNIFYWTKAIIITRKYGDCSHETNIRWERL